MKYLLSFFLCLSAVAGYSQGFPFYATQPVRINTPTDILSRAMQEGEPYASQFYSGSVVWDGTTAGGGQSLYP